MTFQTFSYRDARVALRNLRPFVLSLPGDHKARKAYRQLRQICDNTHADSRQFGSCGWNGQHALNILCYIRCNLTGALQCEN